MKFNLIIKATLINVKNYYDKCLNFGYFYKFLDTKVDLYQTSFKLDVIKSKVKSIIWIMKEESNVLSE